MNSNLATKLRQGTTKSHTMAENTAFMKCFLKGIVEKEPLRLLIADFYFLYSALEEEIYRHQNNQLISLIYFPELERQAKLEEDLAFYYGKDWHKQIKPSPEGKKYLDRIHEVANTEPALLVAHAYVRYLGDLSGGQALRNIIRSALDLPVDKGTKFYEFDQIPTIEAKKDFKIKYRNALNSLSIDNVLSQKIIDEANYAFELNCHIFHELEPKVRKAIGEQAFDLIVGEDRLGTTEKDLKQYHQDKEIIKSTSS